VKRGKVRAIWIRHPIYNGNSILESGIQFNKEFEPKKEERKFTGVLEKTK
jgi:hypothetical protein